MPDDSQAHERKWGKWAQRGVPHKGWYCVSEFDAIEESGELHTCEMCERAEIRFVHVMAHEHFSDQLACGCICATKMSEEVLQTAEREKRMRSRASRRRKFGNRKAWRTSLRGNPHIKVGNMHVVVAQSLGGTFHIGSKHALEVSFEWDTKGYSTQLDAKTACFDLVEKLK